MCIYVLNVVESAQGNVGTVGRFACVFVCVCANALSNEITSVGSFGYYSHWNVNEIHNESHGAHLFRRKYNYMQNAVNSLFHLPFCQICALTPPTTTTTTTTTRHTLTTTSMKPIHVVFEPGCVCFFSLFSHQFYRSDLDIIIGRERQRKSAHGYVHTHFYGLPRYRLLKYAY